MKKLFFMLVLSGSVWLQARSACIIIHGTWAQNESWHTSCGDFFKAVNRSAQEFCIVDEVISFLWSGKLSYACQHEAAQNLYKLIEFYDFVILIGHSHGATVGIIASQLIGQQNSCGVQNYKIKKFYALGLPVDATFQVYPDMSVIEKFYNLFSFGDYLQTVNGAYLRCFASHDRLANISVMIQATHPSHAELRHPIIGKDLLKIDEDFASYGLGNFDNFCWCQPGMIQFFEYEIPLYSVQRDQQMLIELDKKVQWMMTMAFFRNQEYSEKSESK